MSVVIMGRGVGWGAVKLSEAVFKSSKSNIQTEEHFFTRSEETVGFRGKPDGHGCSVGDHREGADRFTAQQAEAFHTVSATLSSPS